METRTKERLIGAIALVAIVVIVVPELLTGPRTAAPSPGVAAGAPVRTVTIDLATTERGAIARPRVPSTELTVAAPTVTSLPPDPAAAGRAASPPAGAGEPAPATPAAAAKASPSAPPPAAPRPALAPRAATTHAPGQPPTPAVAGADGWVVQLGSFASREHADGLAKELRGKGFRAFVAEFRSADRVLFRVRVGPEQDRARAESIGARLAREGHRGSIAPHP